MRTITVAAYNRPDYLRKVLMSLYDAIGWSEFAPCTVVIGIDPGGDMQEAVTGEVTDFCVDVTLDRWCHAEIIRWPEHLGVSEHPRRLLQYVFAELYSTFNVHLEDDTVLSPDALKLALWYEQGASRDDQQRDRVLALSLHSASKGGENPSVLRYRRDFGVWGWCCTHLAWWLWFSHYWNYKRTPPYGFDWSVSRMMAEQDLVCLSPALSRVTNIGREGGTHQTPEGFDEEMKGMVAAGDLPSDVQYLIDPTRPKKETWTHGK